MSRRQHYDAASRTRRPPGRPPAPRPSGAQPQGTGGLMNLTYAVDRLYESGWQPDDDSADAPLERAPDGRLYPSVAAVAREFAGAGLAFSVRHTPAFHCYRATWAPIDANADGDILTGTVIGTSEREAAVYALAQSRAARSEQESTMTSSLANAM